MVQSLPLVCIAVAVALTPGAVASPAIFANSFGCYVVNFMKESERAEACVTQFLIGRKAPSDCQGEIAHVRYLAGVKAFRTNGRRSHGARGRDHSDRGIRREALAPRMVEKTKLPSTLQLHGTGGSRTVDCPTASRG